MSPARFRLAFSFMAILCLSLPARSQPAASPAPPIPAEFLDRVEGNWEVISTNSPEPGKTERTYVSLRKTAQLLHNGRPMRPGDNFSTSRGSTWRWQRTDGAGWVGYGPRDVAYSPADGTLAITGYWGRVATFRPVSRQELRGTWKYNSTKGEETWRRLTPRITGIQFIGLATSERVPFPSSRPGRLHVRYEPGADSRGNKAGFSIRIFGENLWGHHYATVEDTDIEAYWLKPITDPKAGTPENVIGLEIGGYIWSHVTPGLKRLHLDDITIPFQLDLDDFPRPATELRFMRRVDGRFLAAPELYQGDEFFVEASFAIAPTRPPEPVKVSWSANDVREVALAATADPKLFRSGPLRAEPAGKSTP